ncbi:polysaccharide deacetylase family protein [uncultured Faecalibaculum sp.]|uniref:polysaccharide deacetylase family protein n=1 Tax=uncultured Faecalibaculum sp. TaxID=1729681 RepID=UPI0026010399|nr:polysaccharide deacetylase family protein [uncultured Faecalibaculum sp.]
MAAKRKRRRRRRIRWGRFLVLGLAAAVVLGLCTCVWLLFSPLHLKAGEVTTEYKHKYDPRSNISIAFPGSKDEVTISGTVDTSKVGDYPLTYSFKGHEARAVVHVTDTTPPVLEVQDIMADMTQEVKPEDMVTQAKDASEVTVAFAKDTEDLTPRGKHRVTIVATDASGNTTERQATLDRVEDTRKPELKSENEVLKVKQGTAFELSGISATDDMDPEPAITWDESTIDMTKAGDYEVTVMAADRSGNKSEMKQKVTVEKNPEYGKKVVFLTFDDGPSENTGKILDILKKNGAKATFFVTGNGQADNKYIKQAYDEGNAIGLHTYTHDYSYVYSSVDNYFQDLQKISDMVKDITGEAPKIIRFPGGSSNTISASYTQGIMSQLVDLVHEKGYEYFDWNVSSGDASGNDMPVDTIVQGATACEEQYCTILFHDTMAKNTTVQALPQIIKYYKDNGYVFLPLTEDSVAAHHGVNN